MLGGASVLTLLKRFARELDMAIALTYLERWDGLPRNTVSIFRSMA